jgi:putative peptidoglycan lipid II flippase
MLLRGTAIVSVLTLLSRLLGFVRDLLVAQLLGASLFADAFFVAFRIPNLLRSFAAEGALTSAFVPVFSSALAQGKDHAIETCKRVVGFVLCLTVPLSIVGALFAHEIVGLIAPGFSEDPAKRDLAASLTQLMMPYIICVSLIAIVNSALNSLKIFGASAWAQVTMNLVLIAGALCALPFDKRTATVILALSVLVGGIAQVLAQLPACRRTGISLWPSKKLFSPEVRDVARLMLPATVGASVYQITIFLGTLMASLLGEGSISWLFYADRVAQFPIGIFSIALASVLLPTLANASATSDSDRFRTALGDSLRFTSFIIIPTSAGMWALAEPITQLLFQRGSFSPHSTLMTANAIRALALGLWGTSCYSMISRAFIARKDTITPTFIGLCSLIMYLLSAVTFMGPIPQSSGLLVDFLVALQRFMTTVAPSTPALGHVGIALASSIASLGALLLAALIFSRRYGQFPWRTFTHSTVKSLAASLVMIAALQFLRAPGSSPLLTLLTGIPLGALLYAIISMLLRSHEVRDTLAVIRKLRRS